MELGGAAQRVGHPAGGTERVGRTQQQNPPPWTRNTDAPGVAAIETFAYMSGLLRTVTRPAPLLSTW